MASSNRKDSNELEFQGQVIYWLNDEIAKRPTSKIDKVTQEMTQQKSGKRSDLIIWADRAAKLAFLALELKTPSTPINDLDFFTDAIEKAQYWNADYFAIWNMRKFEVYRTPSSSESILPTDVVHRSVIQLEITQVDDWLIPTFVKSLRNQAVEIMDSAVVHSVEGGYLGQTIDSEIFVSRLTDSIGKLRSIFYRDLSKAASTDRQLRKRLNTIAAEQGFKGFVEDIDYAIAGQIGYRLVGQILFYFALRRKIPTLTELKLSNTDCLPDALQPYWNEVRRYDYEALFKPNTIETLIPMATDAQILVHLLLKQLGTYDWTSLTDDVLGSIFEHLIPRSEQVLLGQFYTPRPVADLLVAFTIDGEQPLVLDPGCGSGTFLMSAYSYLAHTAHLSHKELLSIIWGFDISPFAAELGVINLYRQNMSEYENFPRIVPGNFFSRVPGESVNFPAPQVTSATKKVPVPIPKFDCVIGNPPYLRSQNQDDLDPEYRSMLFTAAMKAGVQASAKTDLFAFFIYHALHFMKIGSRLGFVTPSSWLTANYAISLQEMLLNTTRLTTVIASNVESFFPQVDVNTVLLVAEKVNEQERTQPILFVTLKQPIAKLTIGQGNYWNKIIDLVTDIESVTVSEENDRYRIKLVDPSTEREALLNNKNIPRNWSKFIRAPLSYYEIFEGEV